MTGLEKSGRQGAFGNRRLVCVDWLSIFGGQFGDQDFFLRSWYVYCLWCFWRPNYQIWRLKGWESVSMWRLEWKQFFQPWGVKRFEQVWTEMNSCEQLWTGVNRCEQVWTGVNRCEKVPTGLNNSEEVWSTVFPRMWVPCFQNFAYPWQSYISCALLESP